MEIDRKVTERAEIYNKRYRTALEHFIAAHKQLGDIATDKKYAYFGVVVGLLEGTSFDVEFAGLVVAVKFRPEINPSGSLVGRIQLAEKARHQFDRDTPLLSVVFTPNGQLECTEKGDTKDEDPLQVEYWLIELVLLAFEKALQPSQ